MVVGRDAAQTPTIYMVGTFSFDILFGVFGYRDGYSARETSCLPGNHELDVSWHGILGDPTLHPNLVQFITYLVDGHAGSIIIYARENEIHPAVTEASLLDPVEEVLETIIGGDVHIVGFNVNLRIDTLKCLKGCIHLGEAHLVGSEE